MAESAVTEPSADAGQTSPGTSLAEQNWQRYEYCKRRGHSTYVFVAARCESFYLGSPGGMTVQGAGQWTTADVEHLKQTGERPAYEFNGVMPAINGTVGYQIHNRMDISFVPRGGMADTELAAVRSKVAMQILDHNKFHWKETQVFSDGLIEQRGYYDMRMDFTNNVYGDVAIDTLDPRDVAPDPDAKSYDPRDWYDVNVTRWYSLMDIEERYGSEAKAKVLAMGPDVEGDWGDFDSDGPRNKIGDEGPGVQTWDAFLNDIDARKYRVLDRQRWVYKLCNVVIYPTGDVKNIDFATEEQVAEYLSQGAQISKRMQRTVQWTVTTRFATLHDEQSPYDRFTVIPYFCYFRRGKTRGMVDNAISPQEVLNKAVSQFVHILNTTANSGWIVEENSIVDMDDDALKDQGSKTGLVLVVKKGAKFPEKIQPNQVPQGMDRLIEHAHHHLKNVTIQDEMRGLEKQAQAGIAIEAKQYAQQNQIAIPLDNLSRTRYMVADALDYFISTFYDNARVFRISEVNPMTGKEETVEYGVNIYDEATGKWNNDLTSGDYDTVVTDQPMQVTFNNSQYNQAMEMRKEGIAIPPIEVVKLSNLSNKGDIIDQMANAEPEQTPLDEAKTQTEAAKAEKLQAETAKVRIESQFGAVESAQVIAQIPGVAPLADQLARSAGVVDMDPPPLIPSPPAGLLPAGPAAPPIVPANAPGDTTPLTPPMQNMTPGIKGGGK